MIFMYRDWFDKRVERKCGDLWKYKWHSWYAWRPVVFEGRFVWRETVLRKRFADRWLYSMSLRGRM